MAFCRRGGILQQVGGIVPSSPHVEVLSFLCGVVLYYAVLLVTKVFYVWVPSAPLLTHVAQGEIGGAVIDLSVYREHVGAAVAYLNIIGALQVERAEAQTERGLHVAERSRGSDVVRREHHLVGESISYLDVFTSGVSSHIITATFVAFGR